VFLPLRNSYCRKLKAQQSQGLTNVTLLQFALKLITYYQGTRVHSNGNLTRLLSFSGEGEHIRKSGLKHEFAKANAFSLSEAKVQLRTRHSAPPAYWHNFIYIFACFHPFKSKVHTKITFHCKNFALCTYFPLFLSIKVLFIYF
jgi:hypothetical protein